MLSFMNSLAIYTALMFSCSLNVEDNEEEQLEGARGLKTQTSIKHLYD